MKFYAVKDFAHGLVTFHRTHKDAYRDMSCDRVNRRLELIETDTDKQSIIELCDRVMSWTCEVQIYVDDVTTGPMPKRPLKPIDDSVMGPDCTDILETNCFDCGTPVHFRDCKPRPKAEANKPTLDVAVCPKCHAEMKRLQHV